MTTTELPIDSTRSMPAPARQPARTHAPRGDGSVLPQVDRAAPDVTHHNDDEQERPLTMHWSAVEGALVAHWAAPRSRLG